MTCQHLNTTRALRYTSPCAVWRVGYAGDWGRLTLDQVTAHNRRHNLIPPASEHTPSPTEELPPPKP